MSTSDSQGRRASSLRKILITILGGICTIVSALIAVKSTNQAITVLSVISGIATVWTALPHSAKIFSRRIIRKHFRFVVKRVFNLPTPEQDIELGVLEVTEGGHRSSAREERVSVNRPFRMRPMMAQSLAIVRASESSPAIWGPGTPLNGESHSNSPVAVEEYQPSSWPLIINIKDDSKSSTFHRALRDYVQGLSEDQDLRDFFIKCVQLGSSTTPDILDRLVRNLENELEEEGVLTRTSYRDRRHRLSRGAARTLRYVIQALEKYITIVDNLVSSAREPRAVILGAIRVVIEGGQRGYMFFEVVRGPLRSITEQIRRIISYKPSLYRNSPRMQKVFCESYIDMFRFWYEIDHYAPNIDVGRLPEEVLHIVEEFKEDVDCMELETN